MQKHSLYVQYGCGDSVASGWLNFDASPTLRIQRIPLVGRAIVRASGHGYEFPDGVQYGDIVRGLDLPDGSVCGAYASHVLEHLSYEDCITALRNTYQLLAPGGLFRLVVPDLRARAEQYLSAVRMGQVDANNDFMRHTYLGLEVRPRTILQKLRSLLGNSAHLWMWDEPSMRGALADAGFVDIRQCRFGDCEDPMYAAVERADRFRDESLDIPECALEARKPVDRRLTT